MKLIIKKNVFLRIYTSMRMFVCMCVFISMRANECGGTFGLRARMRIRISNHKGICVLRDDTGGVSAPTKTENLEKNPQRM